MLILNLSKNGHTSGKCSLIQTKISKPFKLFSHTEKTQTFRFLFYSRLSILRHIKEIIIKACRGVGIIRFMSKYVSSDVLDKMYKLCVRPHPDLDDPEVSFSLTKRLESVQYTATLAVVTGAWKGTTNKSKLLD